MLAQVLDPWRYQWHPEVWVLVAFLTGAYIYMVRVIGPKAVPAGQPAVTRFNIGCFIGRWSCCGWRATGRSTTSARSTCTRPTCSST